MRHSAIPLLITLGALVAAAPSQAAFTSDIGGGGNVVMEGDANGDIMRIDRVGAVLSHGRDSAGDPLFASDTDFDTGTAGVQSVNASTPVFVTINGGPGSDILVVGGTGQSASLMQQDFILDGGSGFDGGLVDASVDTSARTATFSSSLGTGSIAITGNGAVGNFDHSDVETIGLRFGSGSDSATVNSTQDGVSVEGGGGNDALTVGAAAGLPSITGRVDFDGDAGTLDTLNVTDAAFGGGGSYFVSGTGTARSGFAPVTSDTSLERFNFTGTAQADNIFKSGTLPVTINAGGGDDLISSRDSIGDTDNCGAGSDFVLTDSLDTLSECESSDRTLAQPPSGGDPGTGTGSEMTTMMTTMMTMPGEMADKTAPTAALSGLKSTIKLKTLLKGLKGKVLADEPAAYEVQLLGSTSKSVRLSRTYNVTLARQNLTAGAGIRDIKLRPNKRLIGKARKFSVRVIVTPTDAAGNRGKPVTKTLKVKR